MTVGDAVYNVGVGASVSPEGVAVSKIVGGAVYNVGVGADV